MEKYAILIGCRGNGSREDALVYPEEDVRRIGKWLEDIGGWGERNVHVYKNNGKDLLDFISKKGTNQATGLDDFVFIYFSGHAVIHNQQVALELPSSYVAVKDILRLTYKSGCHVLMVLDCCSPKAEPSAFAPLLNLLETFESKEPAADFRSRHTVILSCDYGEDSFESEVAEGSFFASAFLQALNGADGDSRVFYNTPGLISTMSIVDYTRASLRGIQDPQHFGTNQYLRHIRQGTRTRPDIKSKRDTLPFGFIDLPVPVAHMASATDTSSRGTLIWQSNNGESPVLSICTLDDLSGFAFGYDKVIEIVEVEYQFDGYSQYVVSQHRMLELNEPPYNFVLSGTSDNDYLAVTAANSDNFALYQMNRLDRPLHQLESISRFWLVPGAHSVLMLTADSAMNLLPLGDGDNKLTVPIGALKVMHLALSDESIVIATYENNVLRFKIPKWQDIGKLMSIPLHVPYPYGICERIVLSPDGGHIACGYRSGDSGLVQLWQPDNPEAPYLTFECRSTVSALAFSDDSKWMVVAEGQCVHLLGKDYDGTFSLRETLTIQTSEPNDTYPGDHIAALAFSPPVYSRLMLAIGTTGGSVFMWDIMKNQCTGLSHEKDDRIFDLKMVPTNRYSAYLIVSSTRAVKLWQLDIESPDSRLASSINSFSGNVK